MLNPLVSILIPLYNAEKYLEECLDSITAQTYKNLEVIIVNDGSSDNSLTIAERYEKKYNYIKVYSQENNGAASARNKAFLYSSGEYIQYLDADDILHPDKILTQIYALRECNFNPNIVSIGKWTRFFYDLDNIVFSSLKIYKNYNNTLDFLIDSWSNGHYSIIHSWLISRRIHEQVGVWDSRLSTLDDSVFFAKVANISKNILYVDDSIVYWRQDNSNSLSKQLSLKAMTSHLLAVDQYKGIVKEYLDDKDIRYALAMEYSKFIFRFYPENINYIEIVEERLKNLGFNKPLPMPTEKFRLSAKLIGFYPTVRLFKLKDSLVKKMHLIKDSK